LQGKQASTAGRGIITQVSEGIPRATLEKARALCELAESRGIALVAAESCTGGLLSSLLTDLKGVSHVFERGFVVYSKDAKCDLLGIDRALVDNCGAVSRETAHAMARGAMRRSPADVGVAITGFAGPAGDDDEEGLVHLCSFRKLDGGDSRLKHREEHFGAIGRDGVRARAVDVALDMMIDAIGVDAAKKEQDHRG
jgi:nicotinamide-nucleotide amidase